MESIKPKAFRPPEDCSKRGEMSRRILDILRKAAAPMTTRDIGLQMLADRAMDVGDMEVDTADAIPLCGCPTRPARQGCSVVH